jgi:hypothetical protein
VIGVFLILKDEAIAEMEGQGLGVRLKRGLGSDLITSCAVTTAIVGYIS